MYAAQSCLQRRCEIQTLMDTLWQGLARELSNEGACERAIFPDTDIVVSRCALIGNLTLEGVSKILQANLNPVVALSSSLYNID